MAHMHTCPVNRDSLYIFWSGLVVLFFFTREMIKIKNVAVIQCEMMCWGKCNGSALLTTCVHSATQMRKIDLLPIEYKANNTMIKKKQYSCLPYTEDSWRKGYFKLQGGLKNALFSSRNSYSKTVTWTSPSHCYYHR